MYISLQCFQFHLCLKHGTKIIHKQKFFIRLKFSRNLGLYVLARFSESRFVRVGKIFGISVCTCWPDFRNLGLYVLARFLESRFVRVGQIFGISVCTCWPDFRNLSLYVLARFSPISKSTQ